jgi:heparin/heparan-sulfate lyase
VFDRIVASNPEHKEHWLLHSMEEPVIEGSQSIITLPERGWSGKLVNRTLMPEAENVEISKVGGPGKEFWVFGENFPNAVTGTNVNDHENGAWRVEVTPSAASAVDHFLNVMQVTASGVEQVHDVISIRTSEFSGAQLAGRVVLFSLSGGVVGRSVGMNTAGEGTLQYMVADLATGNWQVACNGKVIHPALYVGEGSGALTFEAPAGRCALRR